MNAINYDKKMIKQLKALGGGKRLLLHACCAPCSTACLERLKDELNITVLFYNPNIAGAEYEKRKNELIRFIEMTGYADFMDCDKDEQSYYAAVKGLESCEEGGERCFACFRLRLKKCAELAMAGGYDLFSTTLTVSQRKDARKINLIGEEVARETGATWLYCDFKKRGGGERSIELAEKYGLYRQNYCGCVYSLKPLDKTDE